MNKFENKSREPSADDLRREITLLKDEVIMIKTRLSLLESTSAKINLPEPLSSTSKEIQDEPISPRYESEPGMITTISKIRPISYNIMVKIVIEDIVLNQVALLDS